MKKHCQSSKDNIVQTSSTFENRVNLISMPEWEKLKQEQYELLKRKQMLTEMQFPSKPVQYMQLRLASRRAQFTDAKNKARFAGTKTEHECCYLS